MTADLQSGRQVEKKKRFVGGIWRPDVAGRGGGEMLMDAVKDAATTAQTVSTSGRWVDLVDGLDSFQTILTCLSDGEESDVSTHQQPPKRLCRR